MTDERRVPSLPTVMLVMDETECHQTDVFALVGLIVPIEVVDALRFDHFRFMRDLRGTPEDTIDVPSDLHGCNMLRDDHKRTLPWATDEHRFRCFEHVVDLVNRYRLDVFRVAYYRGPLAAIPIEGPKYYGLCFSGFMMSLGDIFAGAYVIPVMDGLDSAIARPFGHQIGLCNHFRASPTFHEESLSVRNSHNLMDAVFADRRHSVLLQIVDVTAHLLHILDWERAGLPLEGDYKPRLAKIAKTFDPSLISAAPPIHMRNLSDPSAST